MGIRVGERSRAAREREPWFVPPTLRTTHEDGERHATWLELFFDLVFVVAITELARVVVAHPTAGGLLRFAALFVPVYVAWQGFTFYATRFDTDDLVFRLAYFAAMLAIAAMAVLIDDVADGIHSGAFVVTYVALRSIMLLLYWRAWRAVPDARPLTRLYGLGYALGVAIWLSSLLVEPPARYVVWAIALAVELSLPPISTRIHRRVPTSGSHVPERWALFTLIVLGESVVAVAAGTSGTDWRLDSTVAAALGFAAVACLWWLYFDRQASVVLRGTAPSVVVYSYAHLPLLMGLAAAGAGVRLLIARASDDHLGAGSTAALLGGVVVFLLALVATRSVTVRGSRRVGMSLKLGAAAAIVLLALVQAALPPLALVACLVAVLAAVVVLERLLLSPAERAVEESLRS
jgi:low temperature requirement protein LtrA